MQILQNNFAVFKNNVQVFQMDRNFQPATFFYRPHYKTAPPQHNQRDSYDDTKGKINVQLD